MFNQKLSKFIVLNSYKFMVLERCYQTAGNCQIIFVKYKTTKLIKQLINGYS